jgi:hypothetical protein
MTRLFVSLLMLAVSLGGCAGFVRERIYRPEPLAAAPVWTGVAPRRVTAQTRDGLALQGWFWPPAPGRNEMLVFFPGNGGNRDTAARVAEPLRRQGQGLLVADYRGFSDNPGRPSERGLIADGQAFLDLARRLQPGARTYLFGWSLGGAVALELAGRQPVDGVVTLGAFARLADMAPGVARPFLPDRFDNIRAIARVRAPIFLLHGTDDQIVPYGHAARLHAASGGRATMVTLQGAGHHLDLGAIEEIVWRALEGRGPPR